MYNIYFLMFKVVFIILSLLVLNVVMFNNLLFNIEYL